MRQNSGNPPGQVATLLHRFGRLSLMLTAVATTSAICMPAAPASAASRHVVHHGHSGPARTASKPSRQIAREQHKRSHTRAQATRGATRYAGAVHRATVPLANTTWDNPVIPPAIMSAIQTAGQQSGVDPHLLAAIAWRESRFDPNARNRQSSAKGLLQFTTGTWLQVVRDYGAQHNVGKYAAAIQRDRSGALVVPEKGMRAAILRLRNDPVLSAKLAAQNMSQQRSAMQARFGRSATPADLYLLHVLGPTGATRFLTAVAQRPSESSVKAASYDVMRNAGLLARDGRPMTVARTYAAAGAMLDTQHARFDLPRPATSTSADAAAETPIQVSAAP
jgi:Transglycosylase SLT domain